MLRLIYRWRYRRAQNAGAFKLPPKHKGGGNGRVDLGSYLSQSSAVAVLTASTSRRKKRTRGIAALVMIGIALLIGWILLESIAALELFRN